MRKLIVYIACSIDGYIAKPNDNLDFLKIVEKEGEDYGYASFFESVDTILIGRRTFDWVVQQVGLAHYQALDKRVIVISSQAKAQEKNIEYYSGSIPQLIEELKSKEGKNLFCDGGALLIHELLQHHLIDEIYLSIVPILLGDGISLFKSGREEQRYQVKNVQSFDTGLVQIHYTKVEQSSLSPE
ncbi:MAG: dihydrofolate reductase family protein [Bacteroidia bacterium]